MKPLAPNTLLQNRYLVVHLIGKGGMGDVYLAVDQRLGSAVALKRTLHGDDAALGEAFEREARTLARLRHSALPKVSDHFLENDNQYLVMDHISGDDLAKRLTATAKPFPLSWVLFWADQLLDALAYLHTHEPPIIHRDIKPQNLKLTDDNNIVLLDFGLSKNSITQKDFASGSGSTGSVVGYTPHYAPMEQIRGTGTNPRSDIYSLSATLYQLLTNIVPPDALSRADFLLSGKADPIAPISEINAEIPKAISDVILKGMSLSQDQRFADAREMQKILRETYAKLQTEAADKTVAFNVRDEPLPPVVKAANEQVSAPQNQIAPNLEVGAQTIPFGMMNETAAEMPPPDSPPTPNFDATLKIGDLTNQSLPQNFGEKTEVLPVNESAPQSNVQTEVFGGDFGASDYLQNNQNNQTAPPQNFANDDFGGKTDENFAPPSNITGDQTVPLITYESQKANFDPAQTMPASAFNSIPQAENYATENFAATHQQAFSPAAPNNETKPKQWQPTPTQPKPAQKQKSNGFLFGILGALAGLVILTAVGGGAAYYFINQPENSGITNVATPTPVPSATPTPEQTPQQVNANTANEGNSNLLTNASPDNSAVNTKPSPEATKSVLTTNTPVAQPTKPVVTPTVKPLIIPNTPRPATPKPTVKPQVKPTLRGGGIIPQ